MLGKKFYSIRAPKVQLEDLVIPQNAQDIENASHQLLLDFQSRLGLVEYHVNQRNEYDVRVDGKALNKLEQKLKTNSFTSLFHKKQMFEAIATMTKIAKTFTPSQIQEAKLKIIPNLGIECDDGTAANLISASVTMQNLANISGPKGEVNTWKNAIIQDTLNGLVSYDANNRKNISVAERSIIFELGFVDRLGQDVGNAYHVHRVKHMHNLISNKYGLEVVRGDRYASQYLLTSFLTMSFFSQRGIISKYLEEKINTRENISNLINQITDSITLPVRSYEFTLDIAKKIKNGLDIELENQEILGRLTYENDYSYKVAAKAIIRAWTIGKMAKDQLLDGDCKIMQCKSMEILLEAMAKSGINVNDNAFIGSDILDLMTKEIIKSTNSSRQCFDLDYSLAALKHELEYIGLASDEQNVIDAKIDSIRLSLQERIQELAPKHQKMGLSQESDTYKFLMGYSAKTIARFIERNDVLPKEFIDLQQSENPLYNNKEINSDAIFAEAPKELITKMAEIGILINRRSNNKSTIYLLLSDAIDIFINTLKLIIGKSVKNEYITSMFDELSQVSEKHKEQLEQRGNGLIEEVNGYGNQLIINPIEQKQQKAVFGKYSEKFIEREENQMIGKYQ